MKSQGSMQPGDDCDSAQTTSMQKIAHQHDAKLRTRDIHLDEHVTFSDLGLSDDLINGLSRSGFEKPSPIQLSAIPPGRCGLDLVVQAKSGTGKTCVFTIIALDSIDVSVRSPQVLMLAPTREIALQIEEVIRSIGSGVAGLRSHCSIGGLPLKDDQALVKKAHVVIGTPGRVKQLMELSALSTNSIRLFVLDEADKLLEESFQEQINWIYSGLPDSKQIVAASATYTEELVQHLCNYMSNPTFIRLNSNDPVLLGVRQYRRQVEDGTLPNHNYDNKVKCLMKILTQCNFQQCLIFSNYMSRAENLSRLMISRGWPTAHIAGSQEQTDRIKAITRLKTYDCRILISTDLTSRGIDADRIDLVINLDLPYDSETYLHRVGRAGRFGANGAAITLYTEAESDKLRDIAEKIGTTILNLPDELYSDFIQKPQELPESKKIVQVETFQIITDQKIKSPPFDPVSTDSLPDTTGLDSGISGISGSSSNTNIKVNEQIHQNGHGDHPYGNHNGHPQVSSLTPEEDLMNNQSQDDPSTGDSVQQNQLSDSRSVEPGNSDEQTESQIVASLIPSQATVLADVPNNDSPQVTQTGVHSEEQRRIVSHHPPFQSLRDAWNFVNDPEKFKYLLNTTQYKDKLPRIDNSTTIGTADHSVRTSSSIAKSLNDIDSNSKMVRVSAEPPTLNSKMDSEIRAQVEDKAQPATQSDTTSLVPSRDTGSANVPRNDGNQRVKIHTTTTQTINAVPQLSQALQDNHVSSSIAENLQAVCRPKTSDKGDRTSRSKYSAKEMTETSPAAQTVHDYQCDPSEDYAQYNPNQQYDLNQQYDPKQQYYPNQEFDPNHQYDTTRCNQNQEYYQQPYYSGYYQQAGEFIRSYPPYYTAADNFPPHMENNMCAGGTSQNQGCYGCDSQPQDRLQQTLSKHYRQVYIQQSYIRAMASKRTS